MSLGVYKWDGTVARRVHGTGPAVVSPPQPEEPAVGTYGAVPVGTATYALPSSGAVFVATTGNDTTGTGSASAPYASLKRAAAVAPAGSTIVMRAGTYREGGVNTGLGSGVVFSNTNVTVQNYPSEAVWIDGSQVVTGWASYDTNKYRAAVSISLDRAPTQVRGEQVSSWGAFLLATHPIAHWPEAVYLDGVPLKQVQTLAEVGPGKFFVQGSYPNASGDWRNLFTSTHYVLGDNPAGKEVRVASLARALSSSRAGTRLRGIGFRRYATSMPDWGCLYLNAANVVIENCVFEDHSDYAVHGADVSAIQVRNCTFRRCGRKGLGVNYAHDGVIEWNHFEQTNDRRFNYGPDGGAVKLVYSDRTHVRYNRLHDNRGHGIWYDGWCNDTKTYGNWITSNYGHGVIVEICGACKVVDNVIIDNGVLSTDTPSLRAPHMNAAILLAESDDCDIWHNTIIGAERGIHIAEGVRTGGQRGVRPTVESGRICNNVFANMAGLSSVQSAFLSHFDENNVKGTAGFGITHRGNLYGRYDGNHPNRFAMGWLAGGGTSVYFSTTGTPSPTSLTSWAATTGDTSTLVQSQVVEAKARGKITAGSMAAVAKEPVPAAVQALLTNSPFIAQRVGAGTIG